MFSLLAQRARHRGRRTHQRAEQERSEASSSRACGEASCCKKCAEQQYYERTGESLGERDAVARKIAHKLFGCCTLKKTL